MNEFSMDENIALARKFIKEHLVSRGMIVDFAVHDPPKKEGEHPNPHIHIMVPIRPLNADGTWGIKQKKQPLLDTEGNIVLGKDGKPREQAVPTTDWSTKETLKELRRVWAEINNDLYAEKGMSTRVEWRSYEELGIELLPMVHEGPTVRAMEKKGIRTEIGSLNKAIRSVNEFLERAKKVMTWIVEKKQLLQEALNAVPEPTLAAYLGEYYEHRNKVAETFAYGTEKAQLHNLQDFAKTINFLTEEKIQTPEQLEERISSLNAQLQKVQKQISSKTAELKKIKELLEYADTYQKLKPVKEQYDKKFIGKKSFYSKHEKELKRYYAAERKLMEHKDEEGKIPTGLWEQRMGALEQDKAKLKKEKSALSSQLKSFERVQACVDAVLREADAGTDLQMASGEKTPVLKTEKQQTEEKHSIRKQLAEKRTIVDQGKERGTAKKKSHGMEI
jgi:DNA repair exonuclease SbcCD ATPase subunit